MQPSVTGLRRLKLRRGRAPRRVAAVAFLPQETTQSDAQLGALTASLDLWLKRVGLNLSPNMALVMLAGVVIMGVLLIPLGFTLALALPQANRDWLQAFSHGLFALADAFNIELIGGDTTKGPLNICITVFGEVAPGRALRRAAGVQLD